MKALLLALTASAALALSTPASAAVYVFESVLNGSSEAPPNASPATGFGRVTFDDVLFLMRLEVTFQDLMAGVTVAHIHAATAVAETGTAPPATTTPTFPGFPSDVTFGTFDSIFNMMHASSYRAGYITANGGSAGTAANALLGALQTRTAYLNIHTTAFPGGEIRGFLHAVPEPSTWALMLLGFGTAGTALRRRRAAAVHLK